MQRLVHLSPERRISGCLSHCPFILEDVAMRYINCTIPRFDEERPAALRENHESGRYAVDARTVIL